MNLKALPAVPDPLALTEALHRSQPLADLRQRIRASEERFEQIKALLPPALVAHVKPGPLDADGWSLLAANVAVAAKLRQLQPRLEAALAGHGSAATTIRIKVVQAPLAR